MRIALIFGITGQDGSYLAELLLAKGYQVHGVVRRTSLIHTPRINHLYEKYSGSQQLNLHFGDIMDQSRVHELVSKIRPTEIYNLAAQSHVRVSFDEPAYTSQVTAIGALNVLEAVRVFSPESKVYQASSSEMFGNESPPQSEETRLTPRSPYGASKVFAHNMVQNYREAYGLFLVSGILFNHESPRRGETFVTRKISLAAARIKLGLQSRLTLGNLDARRDWGYAPEYVVAMWRMLQIENPADFIVSSGNSISVREFLDAAFSSLDLDYKNHVDFDEKYLRPTEVDYLRGESTRSEDLLDWKSEVNGAALAELMGLADLEQLTRGGIDSPSSNLWMNETS